MEKNIVIQNITKEDVPEIVALGLSTKELQLQNDGFYYYSEEMVESFITSPNDIYLVAKIDGQIAGYRLATFNPYLKEAYLIDMVVKPEYRGLGVASRLYDKTFEILNKKGCTWAWVLAREDNPRIMAILEKKGFTKGVNFTFFYKVGPF